jgi:hypothetical protein
VKECELESFRGLYSIPASVTLRLPSKEEGLVMPLDVDNV